MKEITSEDIRNIALVGHGGTGKTSLTEAILFCAGALNRMGSTDAGNTTSDYTEEEIARKMSLAVSLTHCDWKGRHISVLDAPGYSDFIGETICSLRAADTAVCLLNATGGVEVGAEHTLQLLDEGDRPRLFYVNKMDKEHADFAAAVEALRERYSTKAVPVQWPIGQATEFKGIVDLVTMKGYAADGKPSPVEMPIPDAVRPQAEEARGQMVEAAAESDDALLEKFFESGALSDEELVTGLRKAVADGKVFPILCGAATTAAGVPLFMSFVDQFAPSPADRPPVEGTNPADDQAATRPPRSVAPFSALVFKTVSEPHVGELSMVRVFSGRLAHGDEVINTTRDQTERIGQVYLLNGKERSEVGTLVAGQIGAVVKLKTTHTGDTLSDKKYTIKLPPLVLPRPVIEMGVKASAKGDEDKMGNGLSRLHEEDPTFFHRVDSELRQTIIYGQGEMHFDVITNKLKKRFGVEVNLEKPRIPYRETITGKTEIEFKYKKQTGGRGQYGHVFLRIEPRGRGEGYEFADEIKGGVIPSKFVPSVEKGVVEAMHEGGLSGHPVVDTRVAVFYGSYHTVDSSDMAFKTAGLMAFKEGFLKCHPVMLEPIYNVEIMVPDDFTGDVMGDMSSRRGKIMGMDPMGKWQKIRAQTPQAELYKYATKLRSLTQGLGTYSSEFSHYELVPREFAEQVIEEAKAAKKAAEA